MNDLEFELYLRRIVITQEWEILKRFISMFDVILKAFGVVNAS